MGLAAETTDWKQLMTCHGPALLLYARQILKDPAHAEDAVQEGFVRFWKNRASARHEPALLYASVRTAALDLLRSDHRRKTRERAASKSEVTRLAPQSDALERAKAIERALATLPDAQRETVIMKIWGKLTLAQIAQVTGDNLGTIGSRYRYAMEKLAESLAEVHDAG